MLTWEVWGPGSARYVIVMRSVTTDWGGYWQHVAEARVTEATLCRTVAELLEQVRAWQWEQASTAAQAGGAL